MNRTLGFIAAAGWTAALVAGAYIALDERGDDAPAAEARLPSQTISAIGLAADGRVKALACGGCHGADGVAANDHYPNLAGQGRSYLMQQLSNFRSGARSSDPVMASFARPLTDQDIADVAAYFACLSKEGDEPEEGLQTCS